MREIAQNLPTVLILGALVAIFLSVQRQNRTPRVTLWLFGWGLTLLHFLVPSQPGSSVSAERFVAALRIASPLLAGFAFLIAVSEAADHPWKSTRAYVLVVPLAIYAALHISIRDTHTALMTWACAGCIGSEFFGGAAFFAAWHKKASVYVVSVTAGLVAIGAFAIAECFTGHGHIGLTAMLVTLYGFAAVLLLRRYRRLSAGVLLTAGGFLAWATVWAIGGASHLTDGRFADSQLWTVPQIFVACGMILTLLEDETFSARRARDRERTIIEQMRRFAELSTKLLSGVAVKSFAGDIADAVHQVSNFERVAILLSDDQEHLYVGGHSGIPADVYERIAIAAPKLTTEVVEQYCARGHKVGANSYICSQDVERNPSPESKAYAPGVHWKAGDELLIPLRSAQGSVIGCISLDKPRDMSRVNAEEMSVIELLASDLSVAIERSELEKKLVMSEKMASVGQLVSGMAHEINNPLTAVLGYTELLQDMDKDKRFERELSVMKREATRMKGIIQNLVRFARQAKQESQPVQPENVLESLIAQRQPELKRAGIELERHFSGKLPEVSIEASQLRTVITNILNNCVDALHDVQEKRITVEAKQLGTNVVVSFIDSGHGFGDLSKAFDPFFTTKSPGKGTGLGLSICYGIVKQNGGDIYATNVHPHGACVTMELPVASPLTSSTVPPPSDARFPAKATSL